MEVHVFRIDPHRKIVLRICRGGGRVEAHLKCSTHLSAGEGVYIQNLSSAKVFAMNGKKCDEMYYEHFDNHHLLYRK